MTSNQYRVVDFIGGQDKWVEIGQVIYEPLVIDKHTGEVHLFYQGQPKISGQSFGYFDAFMLDFVFGSKYKEIVPDADSDEWYQMLKNIGLT